MQKDKCFRELLPLIELGASWEVFAFASQICLPSSAGSPCPDMFIITFSAIYVKQETQFISRL